MAIYRNPEKEENILEKKKKRASSDVCCSGVSFVKAYQHGEVKERADLSQWAEQEQW